VGRSGGDEEERQGVIVDAPKRVAILDDYQDVALQSADWSVLDGRAVVTVFTDHLADEDDVARRLEPFEIVVAMRERTPFPRTLIERLPKLELLVTTGPFNAVIDLAAAGEHGVAVCGTGAWVPPTTELTWALILASLKEIAASDRAVRAGKWQTRLSGDLAGARLGVVGLGRFGSAVAAIGQAFAMDVVAWSEHLTAERCAQVGVSLVSKEELFATSDVVTVHLVLSDRTRGVIGAPELQAMKSSAYLVNTSRGPIVEEAALVKALEGGWIAGAALDVFDVEPLAADHPLRTLENVVLSPHMGYVTAKTYTVFYGDAIEDIAGFLDGHVVRAVPPAP
jgi:phosphoglycerate dehydrogenase-like enzyme